VFFHFRLDSSGCFGGIGINSEKQLSNISNRRLPFGFIPITSPQGGRNVNYKTVRLPTGSICRLRAIPLVELVIFAIAGFMPAKARGQIFEIDGGGIGEYTTSGATVNPMLVSISDTYSIAVSGSNIFVGSHQSGAGGVIGEYTTSGMPVNASLIKGLNFPIPTGIAISGSDLFVYGIDGGIGEYTTSGATVNARLIAPAAPPGLVAGGSIAISGSDLFVTGGRNGFHGVEEFTTSGALVNASLISFFGGDSPAGIAVSGSDLFVVVWNFETGSRLEEFTMSGTLVNSVAISGGLPDDYVPGGIAVSGSDIFVAGFDSNPVGLNPTGSISEYTTGGSVVNTSLVPGLLGSDGIAVEIPEPSAAVTLGVNAALLVLRRRRSRSKAHFAATWP
jgi:hypothetical protein